MLMQQDGEIYPVLFLEFKTIIIMLLSYFHKQMCFIVDNVFAFSSDFINFNVTFYFQLDI